MSLLTLLRQGSPLASAGHQREILESPSEGSLPLFQTTLRALGQNDLKRTSVTTLQVNVGKLCNQTCSHCHVDAGPDRRELMTKENFEHCLRLVKEFEIATVDITGGAPEMNPHFSWFVTEIRKLGRHVIDRCNLTILTVPGFTHFSEFLAENEVEIVASLPCYLEENCDRQRGSGVFEKSILALQRLNSLGYGIDGSSLRLSLVFNPTGLSLPPAQQKLEDSYREQLRSRFGIEFHRLYTITNMPISRFLDDLITRERYHEYMSLLVRAFNPGTLDGLMCRTTVSVDWQGFLYDCDFNQMLNLSTPHELPLHVSNVQINQLEHHAISVGRHCFGCTAGAGSSCQGALTN